MFVLVERESPAIVTATGRDVNAVRVRRCGRVRQGVLRSAIRAVCAVGGSLVVLVAVGCGGGGGGDEARTTPRTASAAKSQPDRGVATGQGARSKPRGQGADATTEAGPGTTRGGAKDKKAIRALLLGDFDSCGRVFTAKLSEQLYGSKAKCQEALADDDEQSFFDRQAVSMIEVHGRRATAHIRLIAGDNEGAQGTLLIAGTTRGWRVDDFSAGLLRSLLSVGLANKAKTAPLVVGHGRLGLRGGLSRRVSRAVTDCVDRRLDQLPDRSLKELAYGLVSRRAQAQRQLIELISGCPRESRAALTSEERDEIDFRAGFMNSCAKQYRRYCLCVLDNLANAYDSDFRQAAGAVRRIQRGHEPTPVLRRAYTRCARRFN